MADEAKIILSLALDQLKKQLSEAEKLINTILTKPASLGLFTPADTEAALKKAEKNFKAIKKRLDAVASEAVVVPIVVKLDEKELAQLNLLKAKISQIRATAYDIRARGKARTEDALTSRIGTEFAISAKTSELALKAENQEFRQRLALQKQKEAADKRAMEDKRKDLLLDDRLANSRAKRALIEQRLSKETEKAAFSLKNLALGFGLGYSGANLFYRMLHRTWDVVRTGITTMEDLRTKAASMAGAMATTDPSMGFERGMRIAQQMLQEAIALSRYFVGSARDLQILMESLLTFGIRIDLTTQKAKEEFITFANILKLVTAGQNFEIQAFQEVRALMMGQNFQGAMLARRLQAVGVDIRKQVPLWIVQGTLIENVVKKLRGYAEATGIIEQNLLAQLRTTKSVSEIILAKSFRDVYNNLARDAKNINAYLLTWQDTIASGIRPELNYLYDLMRGIYEVASATSLMFGMIFGFVQSIGELMDQATFSIVDALGLGSSGEKQVDESLGKIRGSFEQFGQSLSNMGFSVLLGAGAGSVIPGVGTAAGATVGAIVGMFREIGRLNSEADEAIKIAEQAKLKDKLSRLVDEQHQFVTQFEDAIREMRIPARMQRTDQKPPEMSLFPDYEEFVEAVKRFGDPFIALEAYIKKYKETVEGIKEEAEQARQNWLDHNDILRQGGGLGIIPGIEAPISPPGTQPPPGLMDYTKKLGTRLSDAQERIAIATAALKSQYDKEQAEIDAKITRTVFLIGELEAGMAQWVSAFDETTRAKLIRVLEAEKTALDLEKQAVDKKHSDAARHRMKALNRELEEVTRHEWFLRTKFVVAMREITEWQEKELDENVKAFEQHGKKWDKILADRKVGKIALEKQRNAAHALIMAEEDAAKSAMDRMVDVLDRLTNKTDAGFGRWEIEIKKGTSDIAKALRDGIDEIEKAASNMPDIDADTLRVPRSQSPLDRVRLEAAAELAEIELTRSTTKKHLADIALSTEAIGLQWQYAKERLDDYVESLYDALEVASLPPVKATQYEPPPWMDTREMSKALAIAKETQRYNKQVKDLERKRDEYDLWVRTHPGKEAPSFYMSPEKFEESTKVIEAIHKAHLKNLEDNYSPHFDRVKQAYADFTEGLNQTFSTLFFDAFKFELKSLEDYWQMIMDSLFQSWAKMLSDMLVEWINKKIGDQLKDLLDIEGTITGERVDKAGKSGASVVGIGKSLWDYFFGKQEKGQTIPGTSATTYQWERGGTGTHQLDFKYDPFLGGSDISEFNVADYRVDINNQMAYFQDTVNSQTEAFADMADKVKDGWQLTVDGIDLGFQQFQSDILGMFAPKVPKMDWVSFGLQSALQLGMAAYGAGRGGQNMSTIQPPDYTTFEEIKPPFYTEYEKGGIIRGDWMPIRAFQSGGIVSQPTLGLIGEGLADEAVIPLSGGKVPVHLTGRGEQEEKPVAVTFNIVASDAKDFDRLLYERRNLITGIIRQELRNAGPLREVTRRSIA